MYEPVFTHPPESWRDWWSAVRRFAAGWYGIPAGEVTGYHHDVDLLERQLPVPLWEPHSVPLSPSIHEWAAFAADLQRAGLFSSAMRDRFTPGWDADTDMVTLLTLLEGDVRWSVRQEHLTSDDPPVDAWLLDPSGLQPPRWRWWRQHTPTTSQFALQHLIANLQAAGGGFNVTLPPSPELAGRLRSIGRTSVDLGGQVLIEDDDLVIMVGKSVWAPDEETEITVQAEIGASRIGSIPQLLLDLARKNGGMFHGAFIDLRHQ